jgi:Calpain family cysteine protease
MADILGFIPERIEALRARVDQLAAAAGAWRSPIDTNGPADRLPARLDAFVTVWQGRLADILDSSDVVDQYVALGPVVPGDARSWVPDPLAAPGHRDPVELADPKAEYHMEGGFLGIGAHRRYSAEAEDDFSWMPLYTEGDGLPHAADVEQGLDGDCWLLASLAAAAHVAPERVKQLVTANDDGTFTVHLRSGDHRVDADLYVRDNGRLAYDEGGALWAQIVEKGYAQAKHGYEGIDGGWQKNAFAELFNAHTTTMSLHSKQQDRAYAVIDANLAAGRPVTANTDHAMKVDGLHAWTVLAVSTDPSTSERFVAVRNPWGSEPRDLPDDTHVQSDPDDQGVTRLPLDVFAREFSQIEYVSSW